MIRSWPGFLAAGLILLFVAGPTAKILWQAGGGVAPTGADWAAVRFSLTQASLSALFSVALAIPVARALARRSFRGRGTLITLLGAPFIVPVIVAVLGLLAVFGRNGLLSGFLGWFGIASVQIYGLHGVVIAHVFFNMPLATRILLQAWQDVPAERFRLAASLNLPTLQRLRILEWPLLRQSVPGALMVVFAICLSSFAVALTLGGGPKATTIELAIYQAFRFDYDLGRAAVLALIQTVMVAGFAYFAVRAAGADPMGAGLGRIVTRWDGQSWGAKVGDGAVLIAASLFLLTPLTLVVIRGIPGLFSVSPSVLAALWVSLCVALASTAMALALAIPIALASLRFTWLEVVGLLGIVSSPLVLGTGLFLILFPIMDPSDLAFGLTACVNALMALPFVLRLIIPPLQKAESGYGHLADGLALRGWTRMKLLLLPRARRGLGFAAGLTAAMSMGDLGVVTLFADPQRATLPLQMFRLMGAYRMQEAMAAGLILLVASLSLFCVFDYWGRADADA